MRIRLGLLSKLPALLRPASVKVLGPGKAREANH
jgi:hypothetical protein